MKRYGFIIGGVCILCFFLGVAACTDMTPQDRQSTQNRQPVQNDSFSGTIQELSSQIFLMTEESDYLLMGADFSKMIGKKVSVTGDLTEKEGVYIITVRTVSEVR